MNNLLNKCYKSSQLRKNYPNLSMAWVDCCPGAVYPRHYWAHRGGGESGGGQDQGLQGHEGKLCRWKRVPIVWTYNCWKEVSSNIWIIYFKYQRLKMKIIKLKKKTFLHSPERVFHKLFAIEECQYWQLCFSCAIRNEPDQWSLQSSNSILLSTLISNLTFSNIIWCEKKKTANDIANFCVCEKPEWHRGTFRHILRFQVRRDGYSVSARYQR